MIKADRLTKAFGDGARKTAVLDAVSFSADSGAILTLLGPSGSGKTTSLRCVAGLEMPDAGEISLGSRVVYSSASKINLPPNKRRLGMVFQSYAIWPHMSVAQNVAYPLRRRRLSKDEVRRLVKRALDQVELAHLADRDAPSLSGGQQQRVALARAIVDEPAVLLLDEPLSNLDAKLRAQMRQELLALQRRLGLTMLYVTHDQEEALALSTEVVIMREGAIVETGTPEQLYDEPLHRFTAEFLGESNFLPGTLPSHGGEPGLVAIETAFGRFTGKARASASARPELFFRPNRVTVLAASAGTVGEDPNLGEGTVTDMTFLGEFVDLIVRRDDASLRLRLRRDTCRALGDNIRFSLDPGALVFVPAPS